MDEISDQITIVCCIEYGRLETQTLLMLKSLRHFGGKFANVPVLVIQGRRGAAIRKKTIQELDALRARLIRAPSRDNTIKWFNYGNKIAAVTVAERVAKTSTLVWIDSDIIFAAAPDGLLLGVEEDFAARFEVLPPAVCEGNNENVPYWRKICLLLGVDYDQLPWVDRGDGTPLQKMYFNSGVFVWRRDRGFAKRYSLAFKTLMESRLAQSTGVFFTADQVILGPVIVGNNMRWRQLEHREHLMAFPGLIDGPLKCPPLGDGAIIHYSGSLNPSHRERFLRRLRAESPILATWLEKEVRDMSLGSTTLPNRALAVWLKAWRKLKWELYSMRSRPIPD